MHFGIFNFTFKVFIFTISNNSSKHFMSKISKHYLCIWNCSLTLKDLDIFLWRLTRLHFSLFFKTRSSSQHQVPDIIIHRRSWSFSLAYLKVPIYLFFSLSSKKNASNIWVFFTQTETPKAWICCFRKLYLGVLHFQIKFCLHITFSKQIIAMYYNIIISDFQWKTGLYIYLHHWYKHKPCS